MKPTRNQGGGPYWLDRVFEGSAEAMVDIPDEVVQTCVTSPPYWFQRDYGVSDQLGLEDTPEDYVDRLVKIFGEVRRVLRTDGTVWLNLGDGYAASGGHTSVGGSATVGSTKRGLGQLGPSKVPPGLKPKDLIGIPWRIAFALQADGWWLRSEIIWEKTNPTPESTRDRPTVSHEHIFLITKAAHYYYDKDAIAERGVSSVSVRRKMMEKRDRVGAARKITTDSHNKINASTSIGQKRAVGNPGTRNRRTVWTESVSKYKGAHFATFPEKLIEPCILAGSRPGDVVLDPFMGSGTTAYVALKHRRHFTGYELNPDYHELIAKRIAPYKNQARLAV